MQSVSSRIWTRVAVSISYDDNHCTMGTSSIASCRSSRLFRLLHRTAVHKFLLDGQYLSVHAYESIKKRRFWVCLYFLQQCLANRVFLTWRACEMGGIWPCSCYFVRWCIQYLLGIVRNILLKSHLTFSLSVSLMSKWSIHTVVPTGQQLERNPALLYQKDQISQRSTTCL